MDINQKLINYIVEKAKNELKPEAVFMFGSRARGDAHKYSDYDFAFEFDESEHGKSWAKFCLDAEEEAPSLLPLDLVNMNAIDEQFKAKIYTEAKCLYEKDKP